MASVLLLVLVASSFMSCVLCETDKNGRPSATHRANGEPISADKTSKDLAAKLQEGHPINVERKAQRSHGPIYLLKRQKRQSNNDVWPWNYRIGRRASQERSVLGSLLLKAGASYLARKFANRFMDSSQNDRRSPANNVGPVNERSLLGSLLLKAGASYLARKFANRFLDSPQGERRSNNIRPISIPDMRPNVSVLSPIEDHRTYKMYIGTSCNNSLATIRSGFIRPQETRGYLGPCVYLSRRIEKEKNRAVFEGTLDDSGPCLLEVLVNVGRVFRISQMSNPLRTTWMFTNRFDSAWVPPFSLSISPSGMEESCIANNKAIRVLSMRHLNKH